jgi:hypothetical protein
MISGDNFYAFRRDPGIIFMHREILGLPKRKSGIYTDHINRDSLDNRKINLRTASASQNGRNVGLTCSNTSGYKGVCFNKRLNKWAAYIKLCRYQYNLGLFDNKIDAALAYDWAAIHLHGEYAVRNLPGVPMSVMPGWIHAVDNPNDVSRMPAHS